MALLGKEKISIIIIFLYLFISCKHTKNTDSIVSHELKVVIVPKFNSDSAYSYIEKQVAFGPRAPNSRAHSQCFHYLVQSLENCGADIITQIDNIKRYDGYEMEMKNIIAVFNPENDKRVLLCAHWDSRFIADNDTQNIDQPILGANDGGSGVGILLEIARQIKLNPINIGIDIVLFDIEDQGQPNSSSNPISHSWCLGAQYWSMKPHIENYFADYGILLDMVGSKSATFTQEFTSRKFGARILDNIWNTAHRNGFSNFFLFQETPAIIDDHLYINNLIHIPTINIVEYNKNTHNHFNEHHHKHSDNMDIIDKKTLEAVGQTVLEVIYRTN